jgi:hypothetical protein
LLERRIKWKSLPVCGLPGRLLKNTKAKKSKNRRFKMQKNENQKQEENLEERMKRLLAENPYNEELDPSDIVGGTEGPQSRYWSICQSGGKNIEKIKHAGEWVSKDEDGNYIFKPQLRVVILEAGYRLTHWRDGAVDCRSYDGIQSINGNLCKECPNRPFGSADYNDQCKSSCVLLATEDLKGDDPEKEPFIIQISAAGIKYWKKYAKEVQWRYKRPVFSVVSLVGTQNIQTKQSLIFAPTFTAIDVLDADAVEYMRDLRMSEYIRINPAKIDPPAPPQAQKAEPQTNQKNAEVKSADLLNLDDPFAGE